MQSVTKTSQPAVAMCSTCGRPLNAKGDCVACLVRIGLDELSRAVETPPIPEKSIAVRPFENRSTEQENAFFTDGIQDEILARLSKIATLKVISRASTMQFQSSDNLKEVARQLGVANVLTGSVQKSGDTVRIIVKLIDTENELQIWGETYDRKLTDVFQVETEVAEAVATALAANLTRAEARAVDARPTNSVEAHQAYLKGRYFWGKRTLDGYKLAVGYLKRAIEADAGYAQAYAALADALIYLGGENVMRHEEAVKEGRAALGKALELDESLSEAHASLGLLAMNIDWDWTKAEHEFRRAIELNPNYATAHQWYGEFLADMGRFDEGITEIERAQMLDPLSIIITSDVGKVYYIARRYEKAIEQFNRALELEPEFAQARGLLGLTYSAQGRYEPALAELRKIKELENNAMYLSWLGHVYGLAGRINDAQKVVDRRRRYLPAPTFLPCGQPMPTQAPETTTSRFNHSNTYWPSTPQEARCR